jgi:hypothetical protein
VSQNTRFRRRIEKRDCRTVAQAQRGIALEWEKASAEAAKKARHEAQS